MCYCLMKNYPFIFKCSHLKPLYIQETKIIPLYITNEQVCETVKKTKNVTYECSQYQKQRELLRY